MESLSELRVNLVEQTMVLPRISTITAFSTKSHGHVSYTAKDVRTVIQNSRLVTSVDTSRLCTNQW